MKPNINIYNKSDVQLSSKSLHYHVTLPNSFSAAIESKPSIKYSFRWAISIRSDEALNTCCREHWAVKFNNNLYSLHAISSDHQLETDGIDDIDGDEANWGNDKDTKINIHYQ